jgi:hypothetical protein
MNIATATASDLQRLDRDFETFHRLLGLSRSRLLDGRPRQAAAALQMAALYGAYNHHGAFISEELEEIGRAIGLQECRGEMPMSRSRENPLGHVLHVLTSAKDVGGDSRFVWRWIQRDGERKHSVALTRQMNFGIPSQLTDAVARRGGVLYNLEESSGLDPIARARTLRQACAGVDAVFLHIYIEDVIPLLAFADRTDLPPIVFVVQADHQFFTALSISDLVVHLRECGETLSMKRRGVHTARTAFLPIPLEPVARVSSRSDARKELGIDDDAVVLLTIARAGKYASVGDPHFAEVAADIVEANPGAQLIALGPDPVGEWKTAFERTGGRVRALGIRSDTRAFYEAADIYLDSFPFASNTSLLEAGSYSLPLVSYAAFPPGAAVLGASSPGIDRDMFRPATLEEYRQTIFTLIRDASLRRAAGERTRDEIEARHYPEGWKSALHALMEKVGTIPRSESARGDAIPRDVDALDVLLSRLFGSHVSLSWAITRFAGELPYFERLSLLRHVATFDRSFSFGLWLPHWLAAHVAGTFKGWRKFPVLNRLSAGRTS